MRFKEVEALWSDMDIDRVLPAGEMLSADEKRCPISAHEGKWLQVQYRAQ